MLPLEFLKHLCELAKKSPKFDQEDAEQALAWLDAYETYRNPTIENLHGLWQIVEDAREKRNEWNDKVRRIRRRLTFLKAENKRSRDISIVDCRKKEGLTVVEAEVKADADPEIKEAVGKEFELLDELNDALAALDIAKKAVKDAKGEYYQLKHDRKILTETGGYHHP